MKNNKFILSLFCCFSCYVVFIQFKITLNLDYNYFKFAIITYTYSKLLYEV